MPLSPILPDFLFRETATEHSPSTWRDLFGMLSTVSLVVAFALAFIFVLTLIIYSITAYVGPTIFRTGPWRRNGVDNEDPSLLAPYPVMTGYGRILNPFMTDLTAKVIKAVEEQPATVSE